MVDSQRFGADGHAALAEIHRRLGIPDDYGLRPRRPRQTETRDLVVVGKDGRDRPQRLIPQAASAWRGMQRAARTDGIVLVPVSCFRSVDYQADVIARHLRAGRSIGEILCSVAAPGFSEHHTGRAVDIDSTECEALTEAFEDTGAFAWLSSNADRWQYVMSYPRGNRCGFVYEPWHWSYQGRLSARR